MNVFLFHPHFQKEHSCVRLLESKGWKVLFVSRLNDAIEKIQVDFKRIDLAVIHREGLADDPVGSRSPGLLWIQYVRSALKAEFPIFLTTEEWAKEDYQNYRSTHEPPWVHGFLRMPVSDEVWASALQVFEPPSVSTLPAEGLSPILEEASAVFALQSEPSISIQWDRSDVEATRAVSAPPSSSIPSHTLDPVPPVEVSPPFTPPPPPPLSEGEVSFHEPLRDGPSSLEEEFLTAIPLGNALIPGGISEVPDESILKKYLYLREQDVALLSRQLKMAQAEIRRLDGGIQSERKKTEEALEEAADFQKACQEAEKRSQAEREKGEAEIQSLFFELKKKKDEVKGLEEEREVQKQQFERFRERVRVDIRKVRVNEKELENRLEILKKDSEVLLSAREHRIVELKRKLDLLEFNMDLLQDQYDKEKEKSAALKAKLAKASQVVRVAEGLLWSDPKSEQKPFMDGDV